MYSLRYAHTLNLHQRSCSNQITTNKICSARKRDFNLLTVLLSTDQNGKANTADATEHHCLLIVFPSPSALIFGKCCLLANALPFHGSQSQHSMGSLLGASSSSSSCGHCTNTAPSRCNFGDFVRNHPRRKECNKNHSHHLVVLVVHTANVFSTTWQSQS